MTLSIQVNNKNYTKFIDVSVSRSLDTLTGAFSFTATSTPDQQDNFPIKVGDSCKIVEAGRHRHSRSMDVGRYGEVPGTGHVGDFYGLRQPSGPSDIRLNKVDSPGGNILLKDEASLTTRLIPSYRYIHRGSHFCTSLDVIRGYRFLKPIDVMRFKLMSHLNSRGYVPSSIGIYHQQGILSDRLSNYFYPLEVFF